MMGNSTTKTMVTMTREDHSYPHATTTNHVPPDLDDNNVTAGCVIGATRTRTRRTRRMFSSMQQKQHPSISPSPSSSSSSLEPRPIRSHGNIKIVSNISLVEVPHSSILLSDEYYEEFIHQIRPLLIQKQQKQQILQQQVLQPFPHEWCEDDDEESSLFNDESFHMEEDEEEYAGQP